MKTLLSTLKTAVLLTIIPMTATVYAGPGHENNNSTGGHMDHMNNVLKNLKTELGDKYNQPVPAATQEQLGLGKSVFMKSCVACHGDNGKGNGPAAAAFKKKPADFTDAEHSKFYSDQGRIHIIKKGIENTPMSGWENVLSEKEIQSVHTYVRSLRSTENKGEKKHGHGEHTH